MNDKRAEEVWRSVDESLRHGTPRETLGKIAVPLIATALAQAKREGVEAMRDAAIDEHVFTSGQVINLRNIASRLLASASPEAPDKLAGLRDAWWEPCKEHGVHNCGEDACKLDAFEVVLEASR